MKKTFLEEVEDLYLKKMAKLNVKKQKAIETFDPLRYGYNAKLDDVNEQIEALDREYANARNASNLMRQNKELQARISRQNRAIEELVNNLKLYDNHEVELISKRWGI